MTLETYLNAADVSADDYILLGLATCFIKQDGEVFQVKIAEPIPSAALEAIIKGIPTSYEQAVATTLGAVLTSESEAVLPTDFPPETQLCDEFAYRAVAAARTYKSRPEAQAHVPLGTTKTDFNYSTERKRVLNSDRIVKAEDNVKQHAYTHQVL
jgi:hypothetical protein